MNTKENTIICFKAQTTGKQNTLYIFVLVATECYLYNVKYSNFTRNALYIYIYLKGTSYVTVGL